MPKKLSMEKIIKIRKEIRSRKSRRRLAEEMDISLDTICKYGKDITPGMINEGFKNIIRNAVISGKTKQQIAKEYGLSYNTVRVKTDDLKRRVTNLMDEDIQFIRKQVKEGKTRKQVFAETGIPYHWILKYTKDIISGRVIPNSIRNKIKESIKNGKTDREISEEFNISETSVKRHSVDDKYLRCRYTEVPESVIEEIRNQVKSGKDKLRVAREMNISYTKVKRFTEDLPGGRGKAKESLSKEQIRQIRNNVKSGKTKIQVSRELNLSPKLVYRYTEDLLTGSTHDSVVSGRTFDLLQEIMKNGYAFPCDHYGFKQYQMLKDKFPTICRVKIEGKSIYFFKDKSDVAARAFLASFDKRISNYFRLKRIIKAFQIKMDYDERRYFIRKE